MKKVDIVRRDDGWAYVVAGQTSQSFATREDALAAGKAAYEEYETKEADLEAGLRDSFPASDPVAVTQRGITGDSED